MATIILTHKVADYAKWRPVYIADFQRRKDAGFITSKIYREANDPNTIYIIAEVADPGILTNMMSDPKLAEKMEESGVISKPTVIVLNPA